MASTRRRERVPPKRPGPRAAAARRRSEHASRSVAWSCRSLGSSRIRDRGTRLAAREHAADPGPEPRQSTSRRRHRREGQGKKGTPQKYRIPRQTPDARRVPPHRPHERHARRVPELDRRAVRAHAQVGPARRPAHGRDAVALLELQQFRDFVRRRVPKINIVRQRHGQDVRRRPAQQVEVVVVDDVRRVEDAGGFRRHRPR